MIIKSVELNNFRNYKSEIISFGNGINLLYGQNAQGKTNILEALYISATGKSHRTNNYHDLIKTGEIGFEIKFDAFADGRDVTIKIKYSTDKGRYAEVNGIRRNKISEILGTLNMILFSPETLEVIKGSPLIRRKFLDILICQTNRHYLHCVQQYNVIIKNKSMALRKKNFDQKYLEMLPIWNDQLSLYGSQIAFHRMNAIIEINRYMKNVMNQISNGREESQIVYKTFCNIDNLESVSEFESKLKVLLQKGMDKEINTSQCLFGTHRDDFEILLNGMNSRQYCSQGQQRSLALSLIISELSYVEKEKGEKPVLLLDDVLSELDNNRQKYLINSLYDVQTIITSTDDIPYKEKENDFNIMTKIFIDNGHASIKS